LITVDIEHLIKDAPAAVDSFSPGHWHLMENLESRARELIQKGSPSDFLGFLCDTAFLKQPHRIDRAEVRADLKRYPAELEKALEALRHVRQLDYRAMDALALLPWFGRSGGRAFNSAVLRLVRPEAFAIIDWRNVAVLIGAEGFSGFLDSPIQFSEFSAADLLEKTGTLKFNQMVYQHYNDTLRSLGASYGKKVAEIDLAIWTYSIQKRPFFVPPLDQQISSARSFVVTPQEREALRKDHKSVANRIVEKRLDRLRELGTLRRELVISELCSLFAFVRDECEAFGQQGKRARLRPQIQKIVSALDRAINSEDRDRLLSQWDRWQNMVDTTSSEWRGISLPATMILDGYLVFEDFEPVRKFFESFYDPGSLRPMRPE